MYPNPVDVFIGMLIPNSRRDQQTTQASLDELEKLTDRTREELEDQLDQLQRQIGSLEGSMQTTLENDRKQIQSCIMALDEAQKARDAKARIEVSENVATGRDTRLIAGTTTAQPNFDLSVTKNQAQDGASMAAGVHSPEVLTALLQQSSATPSVVSIVQMMQTTSFDPESPAVQALLRQHSAERLSRPDQMRIEELNTPPATLTSLEHQTDVSKEQRDAMEEIKR